MKIILNSNKELVEKIDKKLRENREKYNAPYCPCVLPKYHDLDHICPCRDFLENNQLGECHCGKYIKIEL